jgi:hypothetical protein
MHGTEMHRLRYYAGISIIQVSSRINNSVVFSVDTVFGRKRKPPGG